MFKKNKKLTENIKEKKVRTVKVGTHQKTVIALWVVLIASVSFGVYKNFTAIPTQARPARTVYGLGLLNQTTARVHYLMILTSLKK